MFPTLISFHLVYCIAFAYLPLGHIHCYTHGIKVLRVSPGSRLSIRQEFEFLKESCVGPHVHELLIDSSSLAPWISQESLRNQGLIFSHHLLSYSIKNEGFGPFQSCELHFHQDLVYMINLQPMVSSMTIIFITRLLKALHWMIVEILTQLTEKSTF